ncbi:hypothetical protein BDV25DRAFT_149058, partial [Aspergillus avenaceus]
MKHRVHPLFSSRSLNMLRRVRSRAASGRCSYTMALILLKPRVKTLKSWRPTSDRCCHLIWSPRFLSWLRASRLTRLGSWTAVLCGISCARYPASH